MKPKVPVKVRVWVTELKQSPSKVPSQVSWRTKLLTVTMLTGAVSLILGGSWLAVRLIINPASLVWLTHVLPTWGSLDAVKPQTLDQIKAEVNQAGHQIGAPLHFSTYPGMTRQQAGFQDVLLPIVSPLKHCSQSNHQSTQVNRSSQTNRSNSPAGSGQNCAQIVELRIYHPIAGSKQTGKDLFYELADQITITGPEELTAIAPLAHTSTTTQGSTRHLPLTQIHFIHGTAPAGIWFHLSGEWKRGSRLLYGQVFQFDPQRNRLYSVQAWSSPAGQRPHWQQVTGDATAELVVDQSIGLEPKFQVYQLKPPRSLIQSVTLELISLTEAALSDRTYTNGLLMARHGLWSPAGQLLMTVKRTGNWSAAAQAQLDLVMLHAEVTQMQADRDWASPTQQILAQVMDGRWSKALNLLKTAHQSGYDVRNLLATNSERLWQRVETALRVNPRQRELQEWGTLILAVRQNRTQAIAWLRRQPPASTAAKQTIEQTLALLQPSPLPSPIPASVPLAPTTASASTPVSATLPAASVGLIGSVTPINTVQTADWVGPPSLSPANAPSLAPNQQWYRVDVIGLKRGQQWQPSLWSGLEVSSTTQQAQQLWQQLGFADPQSPDSQLQMVAWQGTTAAHTFPGQVKALQFRNGQLSLLTVGEPLPASITPSAMVAITPSTLSWSQPSTVITLAELAQQQSVWKTRLMPQLWQDLQAAQLIPPVAEASDPLQILGPWSAQLMELTDDQQPEVVLTIEPAAGSPHTVIFSGQGSRLYSDLNAPSDSLIAIAGPADSPLAMLIVKTAQGMSLQQWSKQNLRFESVALQH